MLSNSPLPPDRYEIDDRERAVWGLLRFVDDFGVTAERFFGRIYRGLSRKRAGSGSVTPPPDPDQMTALRQANRELAARVKEAQFVAARMEAVFARIEEGVIMQSPEGRIVLMNDAALKLLGSIKTFWSSELGRLFKIAHEQKPTGGEVEQVGEPTRVQLNDRILGARLAAVFTPEGVPLGTLMVLHDATRETLADRLKSEFSSAVSHELITPLTALKGMSDVLLNLPEGKAPKRQFLEAIARNTAILDRMINELLDLSEIGAGSFAVHKEMIALDDVILNVIKGLEAESKKAELNVGLMVVNPARLKIMGDDRRLTWAIGHLLDNSLRYTLRGGLVTLRVGAVKGTHVLLEVIDSGVGISEHDMAHIFERFYRGDARTPDGKAVDPRGLGQGLYIARAVAEAHGGYLVASSTPGIGSKFTLGLPADPGTS
jgi:two-component system phosphate regulon sensor histidine kinase PhoR